MSGKFLADLLTTVTERARDGQASAARPARRKGLPALADALLSGAGESSGVALARAIFASYAASTPERKLDFLLLLAKRYGPDEARLEAALAAYRDAPSANAATGLHAAAEPRRQELIRRLNLAPGGTLRLVRMREDVLQHLAKNPALEPLDTDFRHLLSSWFNRGFLVLRRIDWSTPSNILEKIIQYEAVHEIAGWEDLRRRLAPPDRRCFAFFHPQLLDEPLIFVEVALTAAIPNAIAPLLAARRKPIRVEQAGTAVFYSISNCQEGLRGISFGNFLIKQVVEDLSREVPHLHTFVTLSPVPGFTAWLRQEAAKAEGSILGPGELAAAKAIEKPAWHKSRGAANALSAALHRAIARYFLQAKNSGGRPLDPVARFHLGNGARLERINWLGDLSSKGLRQAAGFMVNYLYDLRHIESNHEAFANDGTVVASRETKKLLRPARRTR